MRDSDHDKGLVQFEINSGGMETLGKLDVVSGVMVGSALRAAD